MSSQPTRSNPSRALPALAHAPGGPVELERPKPTLVQSEPELPPVARAAARVDTVHGEVRIDEYFWLRNRDDPEVIAYLEAENRYTEAIMRPTEPLQERLFREMRGRIRETDLSVPERLDGWLYYHRTAAGAQYPIYCRRPVDDEAAEEVILDLNPLASGHAYFRLGGWDVS